MSDNRPRGVVGLVMPKEVCGPQDRYLLLLRDDGQARMVHTEGVAYLVTDEKPWTWTDYADVQKWTVEELLAVPDGEADLADWVRVFGARLESNFHQVYRWFNE